MGPLSPQNINCCLRHNQQSRIRAFGPYWQPSLFCHNISRLSYFFIITECFLLKLGYRVTPLVIQKSSVVIKVHIKFRRNPRNVQGLKKYLMCKFHYQRFDFYIFKNHFRKHVLKLRNTLGCLPKKLLPI